MTPTPTLCFGTSIESAVLQMRNGGNGVVASARTPPLVFADIDRLMSSRLLIQANSGGGKSRALRSLLEQTHGAIQQIVFDPEGEFASLREAFPFVLASRDGGEVPAEPQSARLLCRRIMEVGASAIIDLYDLSLADRRRFVRFFLEELMRLPRNLWRPLLVVIDEAHLFCPERGAGEAESTEAVITLCTQGRKRGYAAVLATQRIAKLHKDAAAELLNKLVGRTGLDVDVRRAGDELGFDKEQRSKLKFLAPGTFFAFGPAIASGEGVALVRTAPVRTTHPEPGKIAPPAPPAPDAIRALAAQFADLPRQAEQEAGDLETAKQRIAELTQKLSQTQTERSRLAAPSPPALVKVQRVIERVEVPVEIPVKVPILRETDLAQLHTAIAQLTGTAGALLDFAEELRQTIEKSVGGEVGRVAAVQAERKTEALPSVHAPRAVAPRKTPPLLQAREPHEPTENDDTKLSNPQQRILDALASFAAFGLSSVPRNNVAVWAEQSPLSSGFSNNLGRLRSLGLINYPQSGFVALSASGKALATPTKPLKSRDDLLQAWVAHLPNPQGRILKELVARYPDAIDRETLAHLTGQSPISSGFSNNLGRLRSLRLVSYPSPGLVSVPQNSPL